MHPVTCCCLCWFKDKLRALNCFFFLYSADAFFFFFYPCRPVLAAALWWLDVHMEKVQVSTVSNGCTDYMYIKYICITFTTCVLNVFFNFFLFRSRLIRFYPRVWAGALTHNPSYHSTPSAKQNLSTNEASMQISLSLLFLKDNGTWLSLNKQTFAFKDDLGP